MALCYQAITLYNDGYPLTMYLDYRFFTTGVIGCEHSITSWASIVGEHDGLAG